jgi:cobalamin biosynthesis Mg chelatase CobN
VLRTPISHRALRLGLALIVLAIVSGIGGNVAMAGSTAASTSTASCADLVIADWYDDGKVGKIYPLPCYRAAIKKLPPDVRQYSNAKEEITRALAFARQGKQDPGGNVTTTTATTPTTPTSSVATTSTQETTTAKTTTAKTTTAKTETTPTIDTATLATTTTDTSGPSSVPVPLLVLGGLAVILLAAGGAGYLRRRMGGGGGTGGAPPAA